MDKDVTYETFLYLSNKKFTLCVIQDESKIVYEERKFIENDTNSIEFKKLSIFLDNNIFKIEKRIKDFIKDIYLILDVKDLFPIQVSTKNSNNGDLLTIPSLDYSLNEAKEQCFKTANKEKIIHMIIDNYQVDNKNYSSFPKNIRCNNFSLDLRFICIPLFLVEDLEKILKKYQISIKQILSKKYIEELFSDNDQNLFLKAKQTMNGFNQNEVKLEKRILKNMGFFEKFFNFFS